MERSIEKDLLHWKQQENHMPILLRGARQVGKSYVVEKFGRHHFHNIVTVNSKIVPIEVKAGSTGHLKSLHLLMSEKNMNLGIRVSQQALHFDGRILSVPFYLVSEIPRLVNDINRH
ncbi:MAG: hypothetical protein Q8R79_04360 [Legionellaceae bacterium]|nr:hypothetical protein [Legionellaceae bacterium]